MFDVTKYFRKICNTVFNSGLVTLKARTSQFTQGVHYHFYRKKELSYVFRCQVWGDHWEYTRETREGWTLLTVEAEANGELRSTYERDPSLGWFIGLVMSEQEICVLPCLL